MQLYSLDTLIINIHSDRLDLPFVLLGEKYSPNVLQGNSEKKSIVFISNIRFELTKIKTSNAICMSN